MDSTVIVAVGGVIGAVGGVITAIIGARVLLLRARVPHSRAVQVVRALYYWLDGQDLISHLPDSLREDMKRVIAEDEESK